MEGNDNKKCLAFSIDSILSRKDTCTRDTRQISPYVDENRLTINTCSYGTEALDARLGRRFSSGESADEDDADADAISPNTSPESLRHLPYTDLPQRHTGIPHSLTLKCKTKKKTRTVFSRQQVFYLEAAFDAKRYLSSAERSEIATSLNLSETQVKVWFQNRRNKWKAQINGDEKGTTSQEQGPIFLPPFLCSSVAAAHAQRGQHGTGIPALPFFRQPVFY